jgi:hypothetical protein
VLVEDSSVAAEGMDAPADVLLAHATGTWTGAFEVDGQETPGTLSFLGAPPEVRWVPGAAPDCTPAYEATIVAQLWTDDGSLDEVLAGTVLAPDGARTEMAGLVPATDVRGEVAAMASGDLLVLGTLVDGVWEGRLAWADEDGDFGAFSVTAVE